jgi:N-ethylmaleimide reductase
MPSLLDTLQLGSIELKNRIVMAPLTRMRSQQPGNIPNDLNAVYYAQRSSAGLIISEATQISQQGQGYPGTPGIHSIEQIEGWKKVTQAVHKNGGKIFLQLWHVGRISHSSHQPDKKPPVAPSALAPQDGGVAFTADWQQVPFETPRALETDEIQGIISQFHEGAKNAKSAGFDGVEVHSANGYLLDQFLQDGSNKRDDRYGGSIENRCRFALEVVDTVSAIWGSDRVGIRISPYGTFNDMHDSDPEKLFGYLLTKLDERKIAYAHIIEPRSSAAGMSEESIDDAPLTSKLFRKFFKGVIISAGGYTPDTAKKTVSERFADAVAFGRLYIANPDLTKRIALNAPLNRYDRSTFYGGGEKGYTDYQTL